MKGNWLLKEKRKGVHYLERDKFALKESLLKVKSFYAAGAEEFHEARKLADDIIFIEPREMQNDTASD